MMNLAALARTAVLLGVSMTTSLAHAAAGTPLDWRSLGLTAIDGKPLPADGLAGKVVLVVNTASFCGFTPQYKGLQALWSGYRERGLVVLGVPSNDFGAQEPKAESEIKDFCETNFDIDFPMTSKQQVIGPGAHPLYQWAAAQTGPQGVPKWNFHKLLIGRDGRLIDWFGSATEPGSDKLKTAVEAALGR